MGEEKQVAQLVTTRPEAEVAADLRARAQEALKPVLALMAEASSHGMMLRFDGMTCDPFGRWTVVNLRLERHYT